MDDALSTAEPEPGPSGQPHRVPPVSSPGGFAGRSSDGTLLRQGEIWKLLTQGLYGYRQLLEELSPEISAEEAAEAEKASRKNLRLLATAILLGACLQLWIHRVPNAPFNLQGFLYDLFNAGSVVAALCLVSAYRIPFAGRLLLPLAALGFLYRPPFMPWEFAFYAVAVFLVLAVSFVAGRLIDFGASTAPGRRRPGLRRWTLLAVGLVLLSTSWLSTDELNGHFPALTLLAALICCVWGWFPGKWLERRADMPKVDEETLRAAAMLRWGLFAWGRALAILLGLLPFILFLNGLELTRRLEWPEDPDVIRTNHEGEERIWFWQHKGKYLRGADLGEEEFYAFHDSKMEPEKLKRIQTLGDALRGIVYFGDDYPEREAQYNELQGLLKDHRVETRDALVRVLAETSEPGEKLYHLARNEIVARGPWRTVPAIFSVEDQLSEGTEHLTPVTHDYIERATTHNFIWQWLLLSFSLMGFTFLWRRGGDSAVARWLGIWLIGVGIIGTYRYVMVFLPALSFDLWHRSLVHPSANLWLSIIVVLDLITVAGAILFVLFVPCAALWVHKCWPAARRGEQGRPWMVPLSFAARILLAAVLMTFCFFGILVGLQESLTHLPRSSAEVVSAVAAVVLFLAVACALGFGLRRRRRRRSPLLDAVVSLLLLAVQVVTLAAIGIQMSKTGAEVFKIVGLVLGLVLLVGLVAMIFRKDLLHVSAARDFSFVVAFSILPAVFTLSEEWSEDQIEMLLSGVLQGEIVPEIIRIAIVMALLPPFRRALEEGFLHLSHPHLGRLRRSIEEALEALVTVGDHESVQRIHAVLQTCGVEDFVLYQRTSPDRFEAAGWSVRPSPAVELSAPLRRFLSRQRNFVDLDRVALEWRFFFVQFELHRLHRDLGMRYLLPICLGSSLRAFLVVQESTVKEQRVVGSPIVGEITRLGLAAASLRAVAQSVQSAPTAVLPGSAEEV